MSTLPLPVPLRYVSLEALREAHSDLLQRFPKLTAEPDSLAAVRDFLRHGRQAGVILDSSSERRAAQSLLDYWSTQLYRVASEEDEATLVDFDPNLAPELPDLPNPYRGLDEFSESDAAFFFGREQLVGELLRGLEKSHLLAVLGASGSGKSSVVRAGLIPALKKGALPGSDGWAYPAPMVPGSNPVAVLERVMSRVLPGQMGVIVVDQFEEVFTLSGEAERGQFVAQLMAQLSQHRVILTMRSDYEEKIPTLAEFQPLFQLAIARTRPLNVSELRRAIEEPAIKVGLKFEDGVVTSLLEAVLGEPAALPLLQFTLLQLWEQRQRNRVTRASYRALGGGREALQTFADQFFKEKLLPEEREVAKHIFLRLVRPTEGLEVTSQRLRREALFTKAYNPEITERVLTKLVRQARLLKQSEGDTPADAQIEVAHEALIRGWPRLTSWLEDERVKVRRRNRLRDQANLWLESNRDPNRLWRGRDVDEAELLEDLDPTEAEFIRAGRQTEEAERQAKAEAQERTLRAEMERQRADDRAQAARSQLAERQAKEEAQQQALRAEMEHQRAEDQAQAARRQRILSGIIGVIAIIAVFAAVSAIVFGIRSSQDFIRANNSAATATVALAIAQAQGAEAAQQAATATYALGVAHVQETEAAQQAATANYALGVAAQQAATANYALGVAAQQAATAQSAQATVISVATSESAKATSRQLAVQARFLLGSQPDLALLLGIEAYRAFSTTEATNVLSDGLRGGLTQTTTLIDPPVHDRGVIYTLAFSPNGQSLAWGNSDGSVTLMQLGTRQRLRLCCHDGAVYTVGFSPDGKVLASGGKDGNVILWDATLTTTKILSSFRRKDGSWVLSLAFSPDGASIAVGHTGSTIDLWNIGDLKNIYFVRNLSGGHRDDVWSVAWSKKGKLASGSADGTVAVWDPKTGSLLVSSEKLHTDIVWSVAWSPDGKSFASGSRDNSIIMWDASTGNPIGKPLIGHTQDVFSVAFSKDGTLLASGSADHTMIIWGTASQSPITTHLADHGNAVRSVSFSPTENIVASGGFDGVIVLRRITPPQSGDGPLDVRACALAGRNFTLDEWNKYFPGQAYRQTCAGK